MSLCCPKTQQRGSSGASRSWFGLGATSCAHSSATPRHSHSQLSAHSCFLDQGTGPCVKRPTSDFTATPPDRGFKGPHSAECPGISNLNRTASSESGTAVADQAVSVLQFARAGRASAGPSGWVNKITSPSASCKVKPCQGHSE